MNEKFKNRFKSMAKKDKVKTLILCAISLILLILSVILLCSCVPSDSASAETYIDTEYLKKSPTCMIDLGLLQLPTYSSGFDYYAKSILFDGYGLMTPFSADGVGGIHYVYEQTTEYIPNITQINNSYLFDIPKFVDLIDGYLSKELSITFTYLNYPYTAVFGGDLYYFINKTYELYKSNTDYSWFDGSSYSNPTTNSGVMQFYTKILTLNFVGSDNGVLTVQVDYEPSQLSLDDNPFSFDIVGEYEFALYNTAELIPSNILSSQVGAVGEYCAYLVDIPYDIYVSAESYADFYYNNGYDYGQEVGFDLGVESCDDLLADKTQQLNDILNSDLSKYVTCTVLHFPSGEVLENQFFDLGKQYYEVDLTTPVDLCSLEVLKGRDVYSALARPSESGGNYAYYNFVVNEDYEQYMNSLLNLNYRWQALNGHLEGMHAQYDALGHGYDDALNALNANADLDNYSFKDMIFGIFDAPYRAMKNMLNFRIFDNADGEGGINLFGLFTCLISVGVLMFVIKKLL